MKNKIRLDTMSDINEFVAITTKCNGRIVVKDDEGHCVNAKSLLGMVYAMEFKELYVESEENIYREISKFIVV